ncbi:MAG: STAS domain-containing protein [Oscillospiraceae bacterium]|nr:STAS domain-containing protein [Oscillospiraceae bacterium]
MTIEWIKYTPGSVELRLDGKLDTVSAPAALSELQQAAQEYQNLILNFEKVPYISSAGLRTLLTVQKQVKHTGGTLTITSITPTVMEVLELTGFSSILTIV